MLRLGMIACAMCALLFVGCGKKNGEQSSSGSSASTDLAPSEPSDGARTIIDAVKSLVPTPLAEPEESTAEPEPYVPAVAEDESKTPQLTVEQLASDPMLFDRKYALRLVEVSGVVIKKDADTLRIGSSEAVAEAGLTCRFHNVAALGKLNTGAKVVVRGQLGRDLAQTLHDCEVVSP